MCGLKGMLKLGAAALLGIIALNFLWSIGTDLANFITVGSAYLLADAELRSYAMEQWLPQMQVTFLSILFRLAGTGIIALLLAKLLEPYLSVEG